jgi:cellulose synthase/poly-beta-1,6-N-acetylglucosamine synthase-like glycosyltransferase
MNPDENALTAGARSERERDGVLPRDWLNVQRELLVRHSILPLSRDDGVVHMAVADRNDAGLVRRLARTQNGRAQIQLAPRRAIDAALVRLFREEDKHSVSWSHAESRPHQSAFRVVTTPQKAVGAAVIAAIIAGLGFMPQETLIFIFAVITSIYLISALYKTGLALRALAGSCETPVSEEEVRQLADRDLPRYTILLPLYQEANMLHDLISGLEALDYPKQNLDVKLLLEEDDSETQEAADNEVLPPYFQKLIVPRGGPRGKPRACNYGLLYAKGEYCVIFDAEDRPDPDQLKKAVVAFRKSSRRTICVQAKLNHYNCDQNLLTRWFTAEYLTWFDLYLPALNALHAPIPLGGTSNHFRTDALREVGGWDPFNVTEDADIGIRVAREGWETRVIDSTTYEEATGQLGNWTRQRSRWIKGYMQTWLVHMRNPWRLLREVGLNGFLSIQVMILGTFVAYFVNPVMWALVLVWYATRATSIEMMYPAPVLYPAAIALFVGNLTFVYAAVMACLRRGYVEGVKYVLISPFYWILMSVAAWKALYELIFKPHYWQKTRHGLVQTSAGRRTPPSRRAPGSLETHAVPERIHVSDH